MLATSTARTQRASGGAWAELGRRASSTSSSSAAASPAPAWRSTPRPAGCGSPLVEAARLRLRHLVALLQLFHGGLRYLEQLELLPRRARRCANAS